MASIAYCIGILCVSGVRERGGEGGGRIYVLMTKNAMAEAGAKQFFRKTNTFLAAFLLASHRAVCTDNCDFSFVTFFLESRMTMNCGESLLVRKCMFVLIL